MKLARNGQGIDRHLLGLQLIATENHIPMPKIFQDPVYNMTRHWRLSTSQCGSEHIKLLTFGPVVHDGFGVGYIIHENNISVNVTSKKSCTNTSSYLFVKSLEKSLLEMKQVVSPTSKL
jgi:carnitine O-acetyltransferase